MPTDADLTVSSRARQFTREHHVVCVDDDVEFLKSLEFFLPEQINGAQSTGIWHRFHFICNPREALDLLDDLKAQAEAVAMVISDQKMPQMKGTEFLAEVKKTSADSIRVLLTGHAGMESAITAINERLLHKYLTKPIENEHDFTVSIQHLLQRFHMQRTISEQTRAIGDLYSFSNVLNAMADFQDTLDYIVSYVASALRCERVSMFLIDGGALRVAAAKGFPEEIVRATRLAIDEQAAGQVFRSRKAVLASTKDANPVLDGSSGACLSSLVGAPALYAGLASGKEPLGLISATCKEGGLGFTETDAEVVTYVANTASIAIHNHLRRLELQRSYAETKGHALALAEANERLKILDQMKTDFLTFVSHELRTPLNIISAVDLLDASADANQQAEVIRIVRAGYERLSSFIGSGLEYLDWFADGREVSSETVDVASIVRDVAAGISEFAAADVDAEIACPETPCPVRGDAQYLGDVVRILFDNALKFSHDRKRIRASVASAGGNVSLTVSDQGKGFPPELASELFQPFTIADPLHHSHGTALNLAKARAIVKAHGGQIRAESPGIGHGATFVVQLPAAPPGP